MIQLKKITLLQTPGQLTINAQFIVTCHSYDAQLLCFNCTSDYSASTFCFDAIEQADHAVCPITHETNECLLQQTTTSHWCSLIVTATAHL